MHWTVAPGHGVAQQAPFRRAHVVGDTHQQVVILFLAGEQRRTKAGQRRRQLLRGEGLR